MKKFILLFITSVLFIFIYAPTAYAVNFSASLSPSTQHVLIKPGKEGKVSFNLHNTGDPITLQLKLNKIQAENDTFVMNETEENLVSFDDSTLTKPFIMTTNENKSVQVTIKAPANLAETDYYFGITAQTVPEPAPEGKTTVQLRGSITSLLLLTIKENAHLEYTPSISLFNTKPMFRVRFLGKSYDVFDIYQPIPVILTVQNQGETAFKADGWISLQNLKNTETYPLASKYLLLDSHITLVSPLDRYCQKEENEKKEICTSPHSIIVKGQNFGQYTLKATVTVGQQGKGVTAERSFIVLPIKALLVLFFMCLIIPLLLIFYINKGQK